VAGYINWMPAELAARQLARVERDGHENLYFCCAGAGRAAQGALLPRPGRQILIEFDNAIDEGNHIHSGLA